MLSIASKTDINYCIEIHDTVVNQVFSYLVLTHLRRQVCQYTIVSDKTNKLKRHEKITTKAP